ncbi:hypothetical protein E2C01_035125 [Portunus trituberculatus]|uniref:Uncharacterized protein n=1 Tax=Portunus trituberculatus TaxID=210409 RepID=A0A5B7F7L4_PORTR|nr:hypothetical protein [Portunus trituberculatus]
MQHSGFGGAGKNMMMGAHWKTGESPSQVECCSDLLTTCERGTYRYRHGMDVRVARQLYLTTY